MDPFQDLNRRIAEKSDQMTKREYIAVTVLHALLMRTDTDVVEAKHVLAITDSLIKALKENP